jgi:hypothetical protein
LVGFVAARASALLLSTFAVLVVAVVAFACVRSVKPSRTASGWSFG